REPILVVDPNRVEILSTERLATAPIKVLRRDNTPIETDVYAVRFYFWNAGRRSIKPDNVLEPIRVSLDTASEILDFRVLKTSRPITHARLVPSGSRLATLVLVFSILERGDGLTGQVIYQGKRTAHLGITGTIEGVDAGIRVRRSPSFWTVLRRSDFGQGLALVGSLVIGVP